MVTISSLMILDRRKRGHPARGGERSTERVEFVMTTAERAELDRVASESGQKLAAVIREAVNEYVADYRDARVFAAVTTIRTKRQA
jgi:predicted DNA-binding protein